MLWLFVYICRTMNVLANNKSVDIKDKIIKKQQREIGDSLAAEKRNVEESESAIRALMSDTVDMQYALFPPRYLLLIEGKSSSSREVMVKGLDIVFKNKPKDLYFYFRDKLQGHRFDGIAGGLQKMTEELLTRWMNKCILHTGIHDVCFSGGVAQNIKACKAMSESSLVNSMEIMPAAGDASKAREIIKQIDSSFAESLTTEELNDILSMVG